MKKILLSAAVASGLLVTNLFGNEDVNLTNQLSYNFDNSEVKLQINGDAFINDGKVILTENINNKAGSFFTKSAYKIDNFETTFTMYLGDSTDGADGLTFTILDANSSDFSSIGGAGGGMGYSHLDGITVEFDTYYNASNDPNGNHVGINIDGNLKSVFTNTEIPILEDNQEHLVKISFNNGIIKVYLDNELVINYTIENFISFNGFFGFTAGTGAKNNLHYIDNFILKLSENETCPTLNIFAQNPSNDLWVPFNNPCDIPLDWERKLILPDDFNTTAIGLPPEISIDENTTAVFNAGFNVGKEYALNNLNEYNTSISNITQNKIDTLSTGWHLLGTGTDINDTSIFDNANTVWKYDNGWKAYSPNSVTQSLIESSSTVDTLENIGADKGFWINK